MQSTGSITLLLEPVAASTMRRVLIDHARRKPSSKRGGDAIRFSLDQCQSDAANPSTPATTLDRLARHNAMARLKRKACVRAHTVELWYFGGLTNAQRAGSLNLSPTTVEHKWILAQAWLYRESGGSQ